MIGRRRIRKFASRPKLQLEPMTGRYYVESFYSCDADDVLVSVKTPAEPPDPN